MGKYENDKQMAMGNFIARFNASYEEDIYPAYQKVLGEYNSMGKVYNTITRNKDFTVILEVRRGVPDEVTQLLEPEARKWAEHFDVNLEFR